VLFFEFFPLFMAIVSVLVGVRLYVANREAKGDPTDTGPRRVPPPRQAGSPEEERGSRRPSMSA